MRLNLRKIALEDILIEDFITFTEDWYMLPEDTIDGILRNNRHLTQDLIDATNEALLFEGDEQLRSVGEVWRELRKYLGADIPTDIMAAFVAKEDVHPAATIWVSNWLITGYTIAVAAGDRKMILQYVDHYKKFFGGKDIRAASIFGADYEYFPEVDEDML